MKSLALSQKDNTFFCLGVTENVNVLKSSFWWYDGTKQKEDF